MNNVAAIIPIAAGADIATNPDDFVLALRHSWTSRSLERFALRLTRFILIFVGVYVLTNTATDLMPNRPVAGSE